MPLDRFFNIDEVNGYNATSYQGGLLGVYDPYAY